MAGSVEAPGEPVDAGLVAASIDRAGNINAAEVADAHHECANCGTHITDNFCSNCGQRGHVHRSLLHVGEEFLHGITHFDGKAWTTLPMLLFRPGRLTRDYIMGRRARYIAPVPLFLLVVFLMFFTFSFVGFDPDIGGGATGAGGKPMTQVEAQAALPEIEAELRKLDAQISAAAKNPEPGELAGLNGARIGVLAARDRTRARADSAVDAPRDLSGAIAAAGEDADFNIDFGNTELNRKAKKALKNPELVLYKIQGKAYKLSFLLVPMSLPWLWLLFAWKRDVRMYDHAVFALYSISFMSLLFVIGSAAVALGIETTGFWFALVVAAPLAHIFAQLKGAYALSNSSAAWRTAALSLFSVVTLALFAALMIVVGMLD